ncbi:MAG: MCE family protein [Planctomycetes bacterium]|nr:MCE family protein [Planctomycetota bacterium]
MAEGFVVSRSLARWQQILLGVAVLMGLGVGGFTLFAVGNHQWLWADTFHIHAGFRQIQGVEVGTGVRVLGRDAGEVEKVELPAQPSGEVLLWLRLDGRVRHLVRADARAQIVSEGMVGGKVIEIDPGSDAAPPVQENALIASQSSVELTDVLGELGGTLKGIHNGEGSVGKLVKEDEAYQELLGLIRTSRGTMNSIKQDADALKGLPVVRSYVQDAYQTLVRPDCERNRRWFTEAELFEPGHAVLTAQGRQRLDELAPWILGLSHQGSEVVAAAYAQPGTNPDTARALTQKQSEAVCQYLKDHYGIHKLGWVSRRKVTALGLGTDPPPVPVAEKLPGVEVLVFVPQGS